MIKETNIGYFVQQVIKLKTVERSGWVKRKVPFPESVADHSFGVSMLSMLYADRAGVDSGKVIKMSNIHDLPESEPKVGDITPSDGISPEEKHRREEEAMIKICSTVENGNEFLSLWREYEAGETKEAKFVRRIDKLEMMIQAREYEKENPTVDLSEFWSGMEGFDFGEMQEIYDTLKKSRS
jgi:putative hydrolases of HD superfamily